jgi:hypothetical protein
VYSSSGKEDGKECSRIEGERRWKDAPAQDEKDIRECLHQENKNTEPRQRKQPQILSSKKAKIETTVTTALRHRARLRFDEETRACLGAASWWRSSGTCLKMPYPPER